MKFQVYATRTAEGDRFAVIWLYPRIGPYPSSFRAALPEPDARVHLAGLGCTPDDVDRHIEAARSHLIEYAWEQTTAIGYRNPHGQEVRRKTAEPGSAPGQRRFILQCTACGREYAADGAEIHACRCVACAEGSG